MYRLSIFMCFYSLHSLVSTPIPFRSPAHDVMKALLTALRWSVLIGVFFMTSGTASPETKGHIFGEKGYDARISGPSAANADRFLVVYFALENPFDDKIRAALERGGTIRYSFEVEIETGRFLQKKTVAHRSVTRTLKHDVLRGEYIVISGPDPPRVTGLESLEEAKRFAFDHISIPMAPIERLHKGTTYRVRTRVFIEQLGPEKPFEALLSLFSSSGYGSPWHESEFTY